MPLVADPVAVETDVTVRLNESRVDLKTGGIDHLGAFRREILTDLYNFSAIDQNVSDKGVF